MSIRSEEAGPIDPSKCAGTVEEGLGDFLRKGGFRWRSSDEPGDKIKGPQGGAGNAAVWGEVFFRAWGLLVGYEGLWVGGRGPSGRVGKFGR